jgi:Tfp pilus assembly protein PilO
MKHPEKKQMQIIGIAAVIIVGFGVLRFYPLARRMAEIRRIRRQQIAAVAQVRQYTMGIPALRRQADDLRVKLADYDLRIPPDRRFADLWHRMAEAMNRHNLQEQVVQPGGETTSQIVGCIPITIQCSGTLEHIFEFLKSLSDFERLIRIEELQLQNDADYSGRIKLNATAKVYYQTAVEPSIQVARDI